MYKCAQNACECSFKQKKKKVKCPIWGLNPDATCETWLVTPWFIGLWRRDDARHWGKCLGRPHQIWRRCQTGRSENTVTVSIQSFGNCEILRLESATILRLLRDECNLSEMIGYLVQSSVGTESTHNCSIRIRVNWCERLVGLYAWHCMTVYIWGTLRHRCVLWHMCHMWIFDDCLQGAILAGVFVCSCVPRFFLWDLDKVFNVEETNKAIATMSFYVEQGFKVRNPEWKFREKFSMFCRVGHVWYSYSWFSWLQSDFV